MSHRVLVISHPAVLAANQLVYEELRARFGWTVDLVVPARWHHEYSDERFPPEVLPGLAETLRAIPIVMVGAPQRHVYLARPSRLLRDSRPDVVFLEEEPFSLCTGQWTGALIRAGLPFGVQADENLDRSLPLVAKAIRRRSLAHASFVAARSPSAAELVWTVRPDVSAPVIPHTVMSWPVPPSPDLVEPGILTVGFAGRFLPEKGLDDLLSATERMHHPVRIRCFGAGPMKELLLAADNPRRPVEVVSGMRHEEMGAAYAAVDLLVLPSRTTPTWSEQFGRVLVEAMSCGRPVVGSSSGEIPWVIRSCAGGEVFPEGDVDALAGILDAMATDGPRRRRLAEQGIAGTRSLFSAPEVTRRFDEVLRRAVAR